MSSSELLSGPTTYSTTVVLSGLITVSLCVFTEGFTVKPVRNQASVALGAKFRHIDPIKERRAKVAASEGTEVYGAFGYTPTLIARIEGDPVAQQEVAKVQQAMDFFMADAYNLSVKHEQEYRDGTATFECTGEVVPRDDETTASYISNTGYANLNIAGVNSQVCITNSISKVDISEYEDETETTAQEFNRDTSLSIIENTLNLVTSPDLFDVTNMVEDLGNAMKSSYESNSKESHATTLSMMCLLDWNPIVNVVAATLEQVLVEIDSETWTEVEDGKNGGSTDYVYARYYIRDWRKSVNAWNLCEYYNLSKNINTQASEGPGGLVTASLLAEGATIKPLPNTRSVKVESEAVMVQPYFSNRDQLLPEVPGFEKYVGYWN